MGNKARRVVSLVLVIGLFFQQVNFAQAAGALSLAGYLNNSSAAGSALSQDKFRPVRMRYFSYEPASDNFKILLDKGDLNKLEDKKAREEAQTLLNYFLVGVTLPDDAFWVNLRPDSQDQIIDPLLEKTEAGRIMLAADLQLKKDTSSLTSPQTPEGRKYWDKLYQKAEELYGHSPAQIPTITRPWIVPGEIIVRESENSAYVYKAGLKVMLEEDYLTSRGGSRTAPTHQQYAFSDPRLKELNQYSTQLIKELIIPKLTKEINSGKRYANLRQVYYSLILSRWFKLRFAGKSGTYASLINTGNLTNLTSNKPWDKGEYFNQYQQSFAKGEYNLKEQVYTATGQIARTYVSGGMNWVGINSANGVILKGDVSNTSRMLEISGSANSPLGTGMQSAVAAPALINANKNIIKEKLDDAWKHLYKRTPKDYFASSERKIFGGGLVLQFNKERGRKRASEAKVEIVFKRKTVEQFDFIKVRDIRSKDSFFYNQIIGSWPIEIFDSPRPLAQGHLLLLPEMESLKEQYLNRTAIEVALTLLNNIPREEHLKIGFNSWGAWGSVNHLHLQSLFYEDPKSNKPSEMPVERFEKNGISIKDRVTIFELVDYPVRGFVFIGDNIESLTTEVLNTVEVLQSKNIAHNLIFTKTNEHLSVYLFPRRFQTPSAFGTGVAFFELGGELICLKMDDFEFLLSDFADFTVLFKEMERNKDNDIFKKLRTKTQRLIGSSEFLAGDLDIDKFRNVLKKNRLADQMVLQELGLSVDKVDTVTEDALLQVLNKILKMRDVHSKIGVDQYKSLISNEMQQLLSKAVMLGSNLDDKEYSRLNRALFEVVYPQEIRETLEKLKEYIVDDFNQILHDENLYNVFYSNISLPQEIITAYEKGENRGVLNRKIIEYIYKISPPKSTVVKSYNNITQEDVEHELKSVSLDSEQFRNLKEALGFSSSSPMQSLPDKKTGGIDWRELPMTIQPMGSFRGLDFGLPSLSLQEIERIDVQSQIGQIKNMVSSGISPSGRRVKELVAACAQKGQINAYADDLLACIGDILKLEEEIAKESSVELKEALVLADLGGNYFQL